MNDILNFLSNLKYINVRISTERYISNSLDIVPLSEIYNIRYFGSILKCYEEFIEYDTVDVVNYTDTSHDALALDYAQTKNTTNVILKDIDLHNYKETKHIIKAVSITICTNLNKLVANAVIPKYFSRDVY